MKRLYYRVGALCSVFYFFLAGVALVQAANVPYANDFEGAIGAEWTSPSLVTSEPLRFTRCLGRSGAQTLTVGGLTPGESYSVWFDLYIIDTWDGGTTNSGDNFAVQVDGTNVFRHAFANNGGNPPSANQTFRNPDEGRENLGFNTGNNWPDAIYRSVEVTFIPTGSVATIEFNGLNLEVPSNESWAIDNVEVKLTSATTGTQLRSTTLPAQNSTNSVAISFFAVGATAPLSAATATNIANWSLREAGGNGTFGDGDDVVYTLAPSLAGFYQTGRSVLFNVVNGPLQPGRYRFQSEAGLQNTNGLTVASWVRNFVIAPPVLGVIENTANDSIVGATALPMTESPSSSGFWTAVGVGYFSAVGEIDYWRFDAEAGDRLTVRLEAFNEGAYPRLYLQNVSGGNLSTVNGSYEGLATIQQYSFTTPGTYYLRVWTDNRVSQYALRADLGRGTQLETEANDATGTANTVNFTALPGLIQGRVAASLPGNDASGDYYLLTTLNVGNSIAVTARFPDGSALNASNIKLELLMAGSTNVLAVNTGSTLNYTVDSNAVYYVRAWANPDNLALRSQYVLDFAIGDGVAPVVTSITLPAEGGFTGAVWDRFNLDFSESLISATTTNAAHYDLRGAGTDGLFGTADDQVYTVTLANYAGGLTASYLVPDGPLQPGLIRFKVSTNLQDRASNPMVEFTRTFTVTNEPGYLLEPRDNQQPGRGGFFVSSPASNGDGTVSYHSGFATGGQPHYPVALDFNNDGLLDLVVPNYSSQSLTLATNLGNGSFLVSSNMSLPSGPVSLAVGRFNSDTNLDLAVCVHGNNTIAILISSNGGFVLATNLTGGMSAPYQIAAGDFNKDGAMDLAIPNYSSGNVRVILGNGDATFQTGTNYPTVANPRQVTVGDLNGDGNPDLALAHENGNISLLFGNGDGLFQTATNFFSGATTRSVAIADVTGDGTNDVVSLSVGEDTVNVFKGNGNGSFQPRMSYPSGTADGYQVVLGDLNGDGALDAVVPGYDYYGPVAILLNNGSGVFTNLIPLTVQVYPLGAVIGDFNRDGRNDLAVTRYSSSAVNVFLGNPVATLAENPPGSGLRSGLVRGNITSNSDVDYYRFTGTAGDLAVVAIETPGAPGDSGLRVDLLRADGEGLTGYYPNNAGWGHSATVTLPYTGTYVVAISYWYEYRGEYRVRISTARPPLRFEGEDNNSIANANIPSFTLTNGHLVASLAGYLSRGDGAGDYYNLGVLRGGSSISLQFAQPLTSGFAGIFTVFNAAGQRLTNSVAGVTNFLVAIPSGADDTYLVRVTSDPLAPAPVIGGQAGYALYFSGASEYVSIADSPSIRPVNLTVEGWVNFATAGTIQHLFAKTWGTGTDNSYVVWYDNGALRAYVRGSTALVYNWSPQLGRWYHVAYTFDDAANQHILYVDGQVVASGTVTTSITYDAHPLFLGADFSNEAPYGFLQGKLDEVRLWSVVRAQSEIQDRSAQRLTGNEAGLVGYWRLDEGTGTMTADATTNNNHGTLINAPVWTSSALSPVRPMALAAQYILGLDLSETSPLVVTGNTLPAEGAVVSNIIQGFTISFNKELETRINNLNRVVQRYGGSAYMLTDSGSSWLAAQAFATSLGGHLATVNDANENAWLRSAFGAAGDLWIGLNDLAQEGQFQWVSGQPFAYTNWMSNQPNNASGAYGVFLDDSTGQWSDSPSTTLRGIVEMTVTPDTDGDGLPDGLDPFASDARNGVELRSAGADGVFNTADDVIYNLDTTGYTRGTNVSFSVVDGPLQYGLYRLTVTPAMRDRLGNPLGTTFTQNFTVAPVAGYVLENRNNPSIALGTTLSPFPGTGSIGAWVAGTNLPAGTSPYMIVATNLNADTNLDLIVANYGSASVGVYFGDTNGGFSLITNNPTPAGPIGIVVADFNKDGKLDVAAACYTANQLFIGLGDGAGSFIGFTNYATPTRPYYLTDGDFNKDGNMDLAVANNSADNISIFLGNGDGTFQARTDIPTGNGAAQITTTDLNNDTNPDLLVVNRNAPSLSVLLGNGNGTFQLNTNRPLSTTAYGLNVADLNGDGFLDAVVICNQILNFLPGNGDGTFGARQDFDINTGSVYDFTFLDIDADGLLDLVMPDYGNSRLVIVNNLGGGNFGPNMNYGASGRVISVAPGDFNHDGRMDLALANYSGNTIVIYDGVGGQPLVQDIRTSVRNGAGRGVLVSSSDEDYWTFTAAANDRFVLAVETPLSAASSQNRYLIYRPDGSQLADFYPNDNGYGTYSAVLNASGTYSIRVLNTGNQYRGEYRFRVSLMPSPLQYETEDNNTLANADSLTFALNGGKQTATAFGYIGVYDSGDFFRLGNLSEATAITLRSRIPATSGMAPWLSLYNAGGTLVAQGAPGATNLSYIINPGESGAYLARVQAAYSSRAAGITNGLLFDGSNDYINTGGWSPGTKWTVQAWVQPLNYLAGRKTIVGGFGGCLDWGITTVEGKFAVSIKPPGVCSGSYVSPDYPVLGQWYHVAAACDGTNVALYVNGVVAASGPVEPNYAPYTGGTWIGGEICCGNYFSGVIQEVSIWNRSLDAAEIAGVMTTNLLGSETGLVGYWRLQDGAGATVSDLSPLNRTGTLVNGPSWLTLANGVAAPPGIRTEYVVDIELLDTQPPYVTGASLPAEGIASGALWDRFSVGLSEDMNPASVANGANYELRNAGPDAAFGTADDQLYTVVNSPAYANGTNASYVIPDGPLQPGDYRFTVRTNVADTSGSLLAAEFIRFFSITNLPGYIMENRNNGSIVLATSLSYARTNRPTGTLRGGASYALPNRPEFMTAGHLNGDTNLDLVVAVYGNSTISIYTGAGDGTFQLHTNFAGGNGALTPVLVDLNGDPHLDLVVGNYGATNLGVYLGNGDATFTWQTNYTVGMNPYGVVAGDLNGDGRQDVAVANYGTDNLTVLMGNGDGTFQAGTNYPTGDMPIQVALGDVNGDGRPDLAVANYNTDNVSLFINNGNGTFAPAVTLAVNNRPRPVRLADLDGDGKLDIITGNEDATVSWLRGNGNGTFQPRLNLDTGANNIHDIMTVDLNADGRLDLLVSGFNNNRISVMLNAGSGQFQPAMAYGTGSNPLGLEAGDFNNDGRMDVVVANYNGNSFQTYFGYDSEPLPPDGLGGLVFSSLARGKLHVASDQDYYSFTANAGDYVQIAMEVPGNPGASTLYVYLYRPDGSQLTYNSLDYYGRGTLNAALPVSGTYTLRISNYYDYLGEHRLRISVVKPPLVTEFENNDSTGAANSINFDNSPGLRAKRIFGSFSTDDSVDYFRLGNLAAGTTINLSYQRPDLSGLSAVLGIYRDSTLITNAPADTTNLVYTITEGGGGNYYARISMANNTAGLLSHYVFNVELADNSTPQITTSTLPAAGTTSASLIDRFTVNFNKDLDLAGGQFLQSLRLRGNRAYYLTSGTITWLAAQAEAITRGGHLVTINDAEENDWILANFGSGFWIGLTDENQEGNWAWASGEPFAYTNWNSGEPNNSGNEDYAQFLSTGRWNDAGVTTTARGLVEVGGADSDGDGYPDSVDPYPTDPYNLFDLRAAGPDGQFDTSDDLVYRLNIGSYSSGLSLGLTVVNGPLQPGLIRFRGTTSLRDTFGNTAIVPYDQFFSIANVPGFTMESHTNSSASPDEVFLQLGPANVMNGFARGKREHNSDVDYWRFTGNTGDVLSFASDIPGNPGASTLRFYVYDPAGTRILDYTPDYYGYGYAAPITLPTNGNYLVTVSEYYNYQGEYQFRISLAPPPVVVEVEANNAVGTATALPLTDAGNGRVGYALGMAESAADLDYFNLGALTNGSTVFLIARLPDGSTYLPAVSLYNASGQYQGEVGGGNSGDSVAEVRILNSGTYYALVRGTTPVAGLRAQYVLEVQVVPTGTVSFPNLIVTTASLPVGTPLSGQLVNFSYSVANTGSLGTVTANWLDRAAFSANTTLGDADDIPLGFFPHFGALNPGQVYTVNESFRIPDGVSGDYYLIVQTDSGNTVNEFVFEADNIFVSGGTFRIDRAPYPDLKLESLALAGPDGNGTYTINWTTANRGNAPATNGFYERFLVRNLTSGQVLTNVESFSSGTLAVNDALPRTGQVTTTNAGNYQIEITTDSRNSHYEFDAVSHASAEANSVQTNFIIAQIFNITVAANPPAAGLVSGGGNYVSGSMASVSAAAVTNELPYFFVNWTESGVFQSAATNYSFTATRSRTLVANFSLPTYLLTASNNPAGAGVVAGQGAFFHGTTNVLTALPNPGYAFTNWSENGLVIVNTLTLTNVALSNRFVVANYYEANPFHVVTTATTPTNVASISGAGTYTNGQSATITAPASVTNPPSIYNFREFRLAGTLVSSSPSFTKLFSTLDPTNLNYVAVYDTVSILPLITNVIANYPNPVPATTNFLLSFQFNRPMDTNVTPVVVLSNRQNTVTLPIANGGVWSSVRISNDTYTLPPVTFVPALNGTNDVLVTAARDLNNGVMNPTNAATIVVDATPPPLPTLALSSSNSSSVTVNWTSYAAPGDVAAYRAFVRPTNYTSVTGLPIVASLSAAARSYTFSGLALDANYYLVIVPVDVAGNTVGSVTTLPVFLPSTVPPPVTVTATAPGIDTANLSWSGYSTANLFGFAGFRLYYETTNFASVAGLTPRQTYSTGTRSAQITGLDRNLTYYFAVVGYNGTNGFNPTVTTDDWSDPFAGNITANLTIGTAGRTVDILQPMTVLNNAIVTIPAGATVRFAPGAGITVQQGRLIADGTALDPIVFTSIRDFEGGTPAAGDWAGINLGTGAGNSLLRHVFVKYSAGLVLDGCAPTVTAFTALYNTPAGLSLRNGAALTTADALLAYNDVGARQADTALLNLRASVIKNNGTNIWNTGGSSLIATQNWWGSATAAEIDATLAGAVNRANFLTGEPLLTPALGTSNNVTQVGTSNVVLRLACRTADAMRVSEDSAFVAVFYEPFAAFKSLLLSEGGGSKTIYAQFRSVTGQTSAPVAVTITFITAGPVISSFNLAEGRELNRPTNVTGTASAPLGMASMEFYVNGVGLATNAGGALNYRFDIRPYSNGIQRVRLLARDVAGRIATLDRNVLIEPTPPPAPAITLPAADVLVTSNTVDLAGTAEPLVDVRLLRNGSVVGTTTAAANGAWLFAGVPLVEGDNTIVASAFDSLGSASSAPRRAVLDSGPPSAPILEAPVYYPNRGLEFAWRYAATGERPTRFRMYWHTAPFTLTSQASGQSPLLAGPLSYTVSGLNAGSYHFAVVGYDDAGNASALSNLVPFTYDPVPPAFSIAFNKPSPVGLGPLRITFTASEPLAAIPAVTLDYGSGPITFNVTNTALNTYEGTLLIGISTPSRPVSFRISGRDLAGNVFSGAPAGPSLVVDVVPPLGTVTTVPVAPVQVTNPVNVAVSLALNEAVKPGSTPQLNFTPPGGGTPVPITLSGSGQSWVGTLPLVPAMGSGFGQFTMTALDALDNVGNGITNGASLEIYNTASPSAPPNPGNLYATPLAGGLIKLEWYAVSNAENYRLYSDPGSNGVPTTLVAENIPNAPVIPNYAPTAVVTNLPAADGAWRFAVSALRRGSESSKSTAITAHSDRTPPPAPTNVMVQLVAAGLRVAWQPGAGVAPVRYAVYRNGVLIRTISGITNIIDVPPRGIMSYTVGAQDSLGNEALSAPAVYELLVGAVRNLEVMCNLDQAPILTWQSGDDTTAGYNVYRNGVKQNSTLLTSPTFTDALGLAPNGSVTYAVKAVNATNAESAARTAEVHDVNLMVMANLFGGSEAPLVTTYFDSYQVTTFNRSAQTNLSLRSVELRRTITGQPQRTVSNVLHRVIAPTANYNTEVVFPASKTTTPQAMLVRAVQETDDGGTTVVYQNLVDYVTVAETPVQMAISSDQPPLAGGLASLNVRVFNRGYADIDLVTARGSGLESGDLNIVVRNQFGQEVSRSAFAGIPSGAFLTSGGVAYLRIPPGSSRSFTVGNILVPDALGTNLTTFEASFDQIYYRYSSPTQQISGPISGRMVSALSLTPYYGVMTTDKELYANEDPIQITGQAIDRQSGQPVPNAPLRIGFFTRGFKYYYNVTSDITGGFTYTYDVPPGISGTYKIWAAHPDVFDVLNQAEVTIYRAYFSPSAGDIRMTKNDVLTFNIMLVNPGDMDLTGFTLESDVWTMAGTNRVPNTNITATTGILPEFVIGPRENIRIPISLSANLDAPDNAQIELRLRSAEGAAARFSGNLTLLPANPVLSVTDPSSGYVDVSVNKGQLLSRTITIANRGLRDLLGVTMRAPTNISWMAVNLAPAEDGKIHLPDFRVGTSNTLTVVFSPPADTPTEYYQDKIIITGTNSPAQFEVRLYALVTSSSKGNVKFVVDNILVQRVPDATVRLKNTLLGQEYTYKTDANGEVLIEGLQEGPWAWQILAPGHASEAGRVEVVANQTVLVEPRLSRSLVTVSFVVTPVPYTDRYEITIEQTFQTHVPAPVLVMTPPSYDFFNVEAGFEATVIHNIKNHGLVRAFDVQIYGGADGYATTTPMINYVPELAAMQSIDIPFRFYYRGRDGTNTSGLEPLYTRSKCLTSRAKCFGRDVDSEGNITGGIEFPPGYGQPTPGDCTGGIFDVDNFCGALMAIANACAQCQDLKTLMQLATKGVQKYTEKAKFWNVIEGVVLAYRLLGCPTAPGGGGNYNGGGGDSGPGGGPGNRGYTDYGTGGGCFVAGTEVLLADGRWVPIEAIRTNDVIRTGPDLRERATVIESAEREASSLIEIRLAGGRTLTATPEHQIWVDGQGWTFANKLLTGDWLMNPENTRVRITGIETVARPTKVYTLTAREDHVFYANGVLVRDGCGDKTPFFIMPPEPDEPQPSAAIQPTAAMVKEVAP